MGKDYSLQRKNINNARGSLSVGFQKNSFLQDELQRAYQNTPALAARLLLILQYTRVFKSGHPRVDFAPNPDLGGQILYSIMNRRVRTTRGKMGLIKEILCLPTAPPDYEGWTTRMVARAMANRCLPSRVWRWNSRHCPQMAGQSGKPCLRLASRAAEH